ncbi:MAG: TetR/AcrR family transcriptional regulator [Mesorhizobium sp.]
MPKISDERKAERKAQILQAAWACFQAQGLHATTMDDIIRASDLSAGAVYSYFPSKEEIIFAAVTTSLTGLTERLRPLLAMAPKNGPEWLVHAVAGSIDVFGKGVRYDLKRIALLGWSEAQTNPKLRELMQGFYRSFRNDLARCVPDWKKTGYIDVSATDEQVAKSILCMVLGFVAQAAILADIQPDEISLRFSNPGGGL